MCVCGWQNLYSIFVFKLYCKLDYNINKNTVLRSEEKGKCDRQIDRQAGRGIGKQTKTERKEERIGKKHIFVLISREEKLLFGLLVA